MLKALSKKGKNNKGFTLIELIVVIAIIGILALLLVPRFAGFTDDARVSNDRNASETIERAFQTLIANQTLKAVGGDATITIPTGGGAYTLANLQESTHSATGISWAAPTAGALETMVERLTGDLVIQAPTRHTVGWTVTINGTTQEVTCVVS